MSGRATLTTVTSSSSMNVAIETRTRVHHLRSIARTLDNPSRRLTSFALDSQVAELLADSTVEARAGELRQGADAVDEANLERVAGGEVGGLDPVDRDFDRLAPRRVADVEDVARRHHQRPRGQRVRRDVADH